MSSTSNMSEDLLRLFNHYKDAVGRVLILTSNDRPILLGTCFLVAPKYALTCHHVIYSEGVKREPVTVVFEGLLDRILQAKEYIPGGEGLDLTLLELSERINIPVLPLSLNDHWGSEFRTFGYPFDHGGGGLDENGLILGPTSTSRFNRRLELSTGPGRIVKGFSGAPVFAKSLDGFGYVVGCISETGSLKFPDKPTCAPLAPFFNQQPRLNQLIPNVIAYVSTNEEIRPQNLKHDSDVGAAWKLTSQLVNGGRVPAHLARGTELIDDTAEEVFRTILETARNAKTTDERQLHELSFIVTGLRAKYQRLQFDPAAAIEKAKSLKKTAWKDRAISPNDVIYRRLLDEAELVGDDFQRIPNQLLSLAKSHGAEIHSNVLNGLCYDLTGRLRDFFKVGTMGSEYDYENLARLFRSAVGLIEFDVTLLSTGYLPTGVVYQSEMFSAIVLISVAHLGKEPSVLVYAETTKGEIQQLARLVARKKDLRKPFLRKVQTGVRIYACGDQYLYRWTLRSPTPDQEFSAGLPHKDYVRRYSVIEQTSNDEIVIDSFHQIYSIENWKMTRQWPVPETGKGYFVWKDGDTQHHYSIHLDNSLPRAISSKNLETGEITRVTVEDVFDGYYSDVLIWECDGAEKEEYTKRFPELTVDTGIRVSSSGLQDAYFGQLRGSSCLMVLLDLYPTGGAGAMFLDPRSLQPLRTPLLTNEVICNCAVVQYAGSTLFIASLLKSFDTYHKIGVWDISRLAARTQPPLIGFWHESDYDATFLEIVEFEDHWEAYYIVQAVNGNLDPVGQIWKFSWPEQKHTQVLALPPGAVYGLSVKTA